MLRNLSITEKLLDRPDPSRAVKRRIRATVLPVMPHTIDVQREGTPPKITPPMRGTITLSITESAWLTLGLPALPEGT